MEFFNPVHILAGQGKLALLGGVIKKSGLQVKNILLVTRGGDFTASESHRILRDSLRSYAVREMEFTRGNPDVTELFQVLRELQGESFDLVVAAGGGSVLDVGKCIAALHSLEFSDVDQLRRCIAEGARQAALLPWVGVPTTSGTGSEVTPWATIWDAAAGGKFSLHHPRNFARIAVVDPVLSKDLPLGLTVSSALDAVCHAVESYWSRQANEVSQAFSLLAVRRIAVHLEALLKNPRDERLREEIGKGSLIAGMAFSNTKTTICHSLSYPLTSMFGIPHGIAAALSLAEFMKFNETSIPGFAALPEAFGCRNAEAAGAWIARMMELGGCKTRLRDYGITPQDFPQIVRHAFTKGRADNNPAIVAEKDVKAVLEKIY